MLALAVLLPALGMTAAPSAAADAPSIPQIQAALLLTFTRFTEWGGSAFTSPSSPLTVAFVADETVAQAFEATASGKNVGGRPLTARRVQWDSDLAGVHVLFIGEAERRRSALILQRVQRLPILTVSPLPDFGREGGIITLKSSGGRVGFAVNSRGVSLSGLRLSSFLLSHAAEVTGASVQETP